MTNTDLEHLKCLADKKKDSEKLLTINGLFSTSRSERVALDLKFDYSELQDKYVNVLFRVKINKNGLKPFMNKAANQSVFLLDLSQDSERSN